MYGCFAGPDSPFSFFIFFSFFFFFLMFLNPRLSAIVLLVDLQFFCVLSFFLFLYLFLSFSLRAPFPSPFPPPAFKIRRVQLISKKKKQDGKCRNNNTVGLERISIKQMQNSVTLNICFCCHFLCFCDKERVFVSFFFFFVVGSSSSITI